MTNEIKLSISIKSGKRTPLSVRCWYWQDNQIMIGNKTYSFMQINDEIQEVLEEWLKQKAGVK